MFLFKVFWLVEMCPDKETMPAVEKKICEPKSTMWGVKYNVHRNQCVILLCLFPIDQFVLN